MPHKTPAGSRRSGARVSPGDRRAGRKGRRRRPQQERSRATCEAILEAAERLLVERGYGAASTNAIARRAGVSVGSLYQYFPSKEAVFQEVLSRHQAAMHPIEERALRALGEGGGDLREVMRQAMVESLAVRARDPALMQALHRELEGIAARWHHPVTSEPASGAQVLARALTTRFGVAPEAARERAWLALTVLDPVGRALVHGALPGLDRERLLHLTVEMLARMLESPPAAARPAAP